MSPSDKTKDVLEQILAQLYSEQALGETVSGKSYIEAQDGQFLGKITSNIHSTDSILNIYGPFGSQYSTTSIFNQYSQYGSQYGSYSINNPHCTQPPKLFINGKLIGYISANQYIHKRISPEAFLYTLKNDFNLLMQGKFIESEGDARRINQESFIEAYDGTFLGKLNPNKFDQESIFNKFGVYGNKFAQVSIFNKFSSYGSQFSKLSPYNSFSKTPPKVFVKGKFIAYLTTNKFINPRIDPDELVDWAEKNVPKYG